jgi:hypothetical protein
MIDVSELKTEVFQKKLCDFLYKAQQNGYGSSAETKDYDGGCHMLSYDDYGFKSYDTWYGGEPYAGITTVEQEHGDKSKTIWSMVYFGKTLPEIDKDVVYSCLRPALLACDENAPWRGPKSFISEDGSLVYENDWEGDVTSFHGTETIKSKTLGGIVIYEAHYRGGYVNIR